MIDGDLSVLVAARNEGATIAATVGALRSSFPAADVIVADDGSRDLTADEAERAGARVLRLPARGKGQALTLAELAARPGPLVLCDADLAGDLRPLLNGSADLAIAAFRDRLGGGFGLAKHVARALIEALAGYRAREPLSGQRALSPAARAAVFPLAAGFGCEARMTIDAARAGLRVTEVELPLSHRVTGRDVAGFAHRGRQLVDALLACGPLGTNHRGLRLPLVGWLAAAPGLLAPRRATAGIAAISLLGLVDDLRSGPERGLRAHVRAGRTTGTLKLVGMPAVGLVVTGSLSGGALVALASHSLNLLDTRPGRAMKAFLAASAMLRRGTLPHAAGAIILLPYDLGEMMMLGDSGSNSLGAVLGFESVGRFTGKMRWAAIGFLAAVSLFGEYRSLGRAIECTPGLRGLDRLGRLP